MDDPLDEFNKIYEELREISLKENQVNLMIEEMQFDDNSGILSITKNFLMIKIFKKI